MMAAWQHQAMAGVTSPQTMAIHQAAQRRAMQQYTEYMQQYQRYQQEMAAYTASMYGSPPPSTPLQSSQAHPTTPRQPAQELRQRRPTGGNHDGRNGNVRVERPEPGRLPRRDNAPRNEVPAPAVPGNNAQARQSLIGALQIKFLIKIALPVYIVFLLGTTFSIKPHFNGKTRKLICIVASVYYFQNVGFLEYLRSLMCGRDNGQRHQDNGENGGGQDPVPLPPRGNIPPATSPGLFIDLRCFIVSFLFSLHPSWYPVSMPSPAVDTGSEERNDAAETADLPANPAGEGGVQPPIEREAQPLRE